MSCIVEYNTRPNGLNNQWLGVWAFASWLAGENFIEQAHLAHFPPQQKKITVTSVHFTLYRSTHAN
jgi:hypothetical protein